jgi:hypothetical protein
MVGTRRRTWRQIIVSPFGQKLTKANKETGPRTGKEIELENVELENSD